MDYPSTSVLRLAKYQILVPIEKLNDKAYIDLEVMKRHLGLNEEASQMVIDWRQELGLPGTNFEITQSANQREVPPGYVRLTIQNYKDFEPLIQPNKGAGAAAQQAYDQLMQIQGNRSRQIQGSLVKDYRRLSPNQKQKIEGLIQKLATNGTIHSIEGQTVKDIDNLTRFTNGPVNTTTRELFQAKRLNLLFQNYQQAQEIVLIGRSLTPEIRVGLDKLFAGQNPSKKIPEHAQQNIIKETDYYYNQSLGGPPDPTSTAWKTLRNNRILNNFPDISIQGKQLVVGSSNSKPTTNSGRASQQTESSPYPSDKPVKESSPQELAVAQFRINLEGKSLERLHQNRQFWSGELDKYLAVTATSDTFQNLRGAIEQDRRLLGVQAQVEQQINAKSTTLSQTSVGGLGPFGAIGSVKETIERLKQEVTQLKGLRADLQLARTTLRAEYPPLALLKTQSIDANTSHAEVLSHLIEGFKSIDKAMADFKAQIHSGEAPLHTLSQGLVNETLKESGFAGKDPKSLAVQDWLKDQTQRDLILELGGTLATISLSAAAFLATGGLGTVLQVAAATAGLGTAVYEFERADFLENAAEAGTGAQPLTDVSLKQARGQKFLAWTNVVMGVADLALAGKTVSKVLKGTQLAEMLVNSKSAGVLAKLEPKQAGQVLEMLMIKLSGADLQLTQTFKSLRKELSPSVWEQVKDLWNRVEKDGVLVTTPEGLQIRASGLDLTQPNPIQGGVSSGKGAIAGLKQVGIPEDIVNRLTQKGISIPDQFELARNWSKIGHSAEDIKGLAGTLDSLLEAGLDLSLIKTALGEGINPKLKQSLITIATSGKTRNLKDIEVPLVSYIKAKTPSLKDNYLKELEIGADLIRQGYELQIGPIRGESVPKILLDKINALRRDVLGKTDLKPSKVLYGADVNGFSPNGQGGVAIHVKNLTSKNKQAVFDRLKEGFTQHSGINGEVSPEGLTQIIEIYIPPGHDFYNLKPTAIKQELDTFLLDLKKPKDPTLARDYSRINELLSKYEGSAKIIKKDSKGIAVETINFRFKGGSAIVVPKKQAIRDEPSADPQKLEIASTEIITEPNLIYLSGPQLAELVLEAEGDPGLTSQLLELFDQNPQLTEMLATHLEQDYSQELASKPVDHEYA